MLFCIAIIICCSKDEASAETMWAPTILPSVDNILIKPSVSSSQWAFPSADISNWAFWKDPSSRSCSRLPIQAISGAP